MTSRNLNRTWRDIIFAQYDADYDANVSFPVRYLINASPWNRDIFIEIPSKISVRDLRRSVAGFFVAKRFADPVYQDEHITVRPRITRFHGRQGQDGDEDDENRERQDDDAFEVQDDPAHASNARDGS